MDPPGAHQLPRIELHECGTDVAEWIHLILQGYLTKFAYVVDDWWPRFGMGAWIIDIRMGSREAGHNPQVVEGWCIRYNGWRI
jgi:type IV secretory pathway TrbD component